MPERQTPTGQNGVEASLRMKIGGMSCSFCTSTIRTAYEHMDGVREVGVSLAHEEGLVKYDPSRVSADELKQTLREGPDWSRAVFATLAVLVLGYPCALGMATPLAMIRGGGMAAERGILMRSGEAFQIMGELCTVVLDKTGTITRGEPAVTSVVALTGGEDELLRLAAAAEATSEHPLARAVEDAAEHRELEVPDATDFQAHARRGGAGHDRLAAGIGRQARLPSRGSHRHHSGRGAPRLHGRTRTGQAGRITPQTMTVSPGRVEAPRE